MFDKFFSLFVSFSKPEGEPPAEILDEYVHADKFVMAETPDGLCCTGLTCILTLSSDWHANYFIRIVTLLNDQEQDDAPKEECSYDGFFKLKGDKLTVHLPTHDKRNMKFRFVAYNKLVGDKGIEFFR